MNRVSNITRLGSTVKGFHGKTIDEAIKAAESWASSNGVQLAGNYYLQVKLGQSESVLVDVQLIAEEKPPITPIFDPLDFSEVQKTLTEY